MEECIIKKISVTGSLNFVIDLENISKSELLNTAFTSDSKLYITNALLATDTYHYDSMMEVLDVIFNCKNKDSDYYLKENNYIIQASIEYVFEENLYETYLYIQMSEVIEEVLYNIVYRDGSYTKIIQYHSTEDNSEQILNNVFSDFCYDVIFCTMIYDKTKIGNYQIADGYDSIHQWIVESIIEHSDLTETLIYVMNYLGYSITAIRLEDNGMDSIEITFQASDKTIYYTQYSKLNYPVILAFQFARFYFCTIDKQCVLCFSNLEKLYDSSESVYYSIFYNFVNMMSNADFNRHSSQCLIPLKESNLTMEVLRNETSINIQKII